MSGGPLVFPTLIVEVGFGVGASAIGYLQLDDALRGKLDTATLGGPDVWVDVSDYVHGVTTDRGARRVDAIGQKYEAGTATILLDNSDRRFDPTNTAGPYVSAGISQVTPMRPVRIRATDPSTGITYPIFRGFADEWPLEWSDPSVSWVTLRATDAIKVLSNYVGATGGGSVGAGELTGARVNRILDAAAWPAEARDIDSGDTTLQATDLSSNAWEELQLAVETELGEIYADGAGNVVFRERTALQQDTRSSSSQGIFTDDPPSTYEAVVLVDSPAAYYPLREASGNPQDHSGNARHATSVTSILYQQQVVRPGGAAAAKIQGATSYVVLPNTALNYSGAYTLECWVQLGGNSGDVGPDAGLVAKCSSNTDADGILGIEGPQESANIRLYVDPTGGAYGFITSSVSSYDFTTLRHVVMTVGTGITPTVTIYLDGVAVAMNAQSGTITARTDDTATADCHRIGDVKGGIFGAWRGWISDVALYPSILSAARVQTHYNARNLP